MNYGNYPYPSPTINTNNYNDNHSFNNSSHQTSLPTTKFIPLNYSGCMNEPRSQWPITTTTTLTVGNDEMHERPKWLDKMYTGIESFVTNAHDPWLSEADRDPLACQECCTCFSSTPAPAPIPVKPRKRHANEGPLPGAAIITSQYGPRTGNCISRHFNNEVLLVLLNLICSIIIFPKLENVFIFSRNLNLNTNQVEMFSS